MSSVLARWVPWLRWCLQRCAWLLSRVRLLSSNALLDDDAVRRRRRSATEVLSKWVRDMRTRRHRSRLLDIRDESVITYFWHKSVVDLPSIPGCNEEWFMCGSRDSGCPLTYSRSQSAVAIDYFEELKHHLEGQVDEALQKDVFDMHEYEAAETSEREVKEAAYEAFDSAMANRQCIAVCPFCQVPLALLPPVGALFDGDEDWVAIVPAAYAHVDIPWLQAGRSTFGCCDVQVFPHPYNEAYAFYVGWHA